MTVKDWEATRVRELIATGITPQNLNSIIISVMPNCGLLKREEIIHRVSIKTGIDKEDLHEHISHNLSKLCEDKRLAKGKQVGFYCIQK